MLCATFPSNSCIYNQTAHPSSLKQAGVTFLALITALVYLHPGWWTVHKSTYINDYKEGFISYHVDHLFMFLSPGSSALDLRGKMFTLSRNYGGVTFYPPYYDSVSPSTTDYPTRRHKIRSWVATTPPTTSPWGSTRYSAISSPSWTTNRRWTYPWTTESPTRGEYSPT